MDVLVVFGLAFSIVFGAISTVGIIVETSIHGDLLQHWGKPYTRWDYIRTAITLLHPVYWLTRWLRAPMFPGQEQRAQLRSVDRRPTGTDIQRYG